MSTGRDGDIHPRIKLSFLPRKAGSSGTTDELKAFTETTNRLCLLRTKARYNVFLALCSDS